MVKQTVPERIALFLFRDRVPFTIGTFFFLALAGGFYTANVLFGSLAWYLFSLASFLIISVACTFGFFCRWIAGRVETKILQRELAAEEKAIMKFNNGYGDNLTSEQIDKVSKPRCKKMLEKYGEIWKVE